MMLCVTNDANATGVAEHLAMIHQVGRQDGVVFVGSPDNELILRETTRIVPSLFLSNSPVFMPIGYSNMVKLRLDSNIIFHVKLAEIGYELVDIFAVKDGASIALELGKWDMDGGMKLFSSMTRWERRTDLKGAEFVNSLTSWSPSYAELIKDRDGNIVGSRGFFQEKLFYITDKLNLTIKTIEYPGGSKLLENGSWTGGRGLFQRKEIDVYSDAFPIHRHYCVELPLFDCPFSTHQIDDALIGASINGTAPNMWVYVQIFGVVQWAIFFTLLILMVVVLSLINHFSEERSVKTFGTKRGGSQEHYQLSSIASGIALVLLYSIQMGSHTITKTNSIRALTLVISMLTFLTFVYYTTDITAKMTSGPLNHPVKNFEDVLHHGYSVIVENLYYGDSLAEAPTDSAKYKVYQKYIQTTYKPNELYDEMDKAEGYKKIATEDKTLLYSSPWIYDEEAIPYDLEVLDLDDAAITKTYVTLALHKDSEFQQLFNYYIQKGHEHGIFKRLYKKYHMVEFTNEHFGMKEPQSLGANNVMFPFIWLCFAVGVSLLIGLAEKCLAKKMSLPPFSVTDVGESGIQESGMVAGPSQPSNNTPYLINQTAQMSNHNHTKKLR